MERKIKFLGFMLIVLILTPAPLSSSIDESTKRFIYEITAPGGRRATGFVISDSLLGRALVTCKHVVQDKKGAYVDSILVRLNTMLPTGEAISDTNCFVVRLKVTGRTYAVEHPNPDIDLVMIPVAEFNTTIPREDTVWGLFSYKILSKDQMDELGINEGADVEVIGFSLSSSLSKNPTHYHFSRFGKVGLYTTDRFTLVIDSIPRTANYILLDMTVRPGDSGSPIFAHLGPDKTYLIGFLSAQSKEMEYGIGYPVYYLHDLIKKLRDKSITNYGGKERG